MLENHFSFEKIHLFSRVLLRATCPSGGGDSSGEGIKKRFFVCSLDLPAQDVGGVDSAAYHADVRCIFFMASAAVAKRPAGEVLVVLGAQWGDEGKGKLIDLLTPGFDVLARAAGGANAGHTIVVGGVKYAFHLLPSGLLNVNATAVVGNGVVLHVPKFLQEVQSLRDKGVEVEGRVLLSDRAHLLFDFHQIVDGLREGERGKGKIGTTGRGIGPCYAGKCERSSLRVGDLRSFRSFPAMLRRNLAEKHKRFYGFDYDIRKEIASYYEYAKTLEPSIVDTVGMLNESVSGKRDAVLVEGANAALLDIDFGTYPFVTSSNCTAGGVCTGLGIPPTAINVVVGVVKAYTTRVGQGPFPTELLDNDGKTLQVEGHEFGTTTERPRRCGWLDTFMLKYTHAVNGYTEICLTKLDVLTHFETLKIGVSYSVRGRKMTYYPASLKVLAEAEVEYIVMPGWKGVDISSVRKFTDLPQNAQDYVLAIEKLVGVPITSIGVGPSRDAVILR